MTSEQKISRMYRRFGESQNELKCKDCSNLIKVERGNHRVSKCLVYGDTFSESSDWKQSHNACGMLNQYYDGRPIIRMFEPRSKADEQIEGQMVLPIIPEV
jgi:hypothetical protein